MARTVLLLVFDAAMLAGVGYLVPRIWRGEAPLPDTLTFLYGRRVGHALDRAILPVLLFLPVMTVGIALPPPVRAQYALVSGCLMLLVIAGIVLLNRPAILVPPGSRVEKGLLRGDWTTPTGRPAQDRSHHAEIHHVRFGDRSQPDYYLALCDCGWTGEPSDTAQPALDEGRQHDPTLHTDERRRTLRTDWC